jgi:hypothetical protein
MMMRLRPLRGAHLRCVCWSWDVSGRILLRRAHHRRSGEQCAVGIAAARGLCWSWSR